MPHNEDNPLPVTGPSNTTNHFLGPVGTYVHHAQHANFNNNRMTNNAPIDPAAITANSASNSNRSTTSATGTTGQATSSNQSNGMSAQSSTPNSGNNASLAPRTHIEPPQNGNIQQPLVQPFAPTRPVDPFRRIGRVGDGGLPIFPSHVMPLIKKEITIEYCSDPEVYAHYWILDSKQRPNGRNTNTIDDDEVIKFQLLLKTLFETVVTQCKILMEKKMCAGFSQEGFRWKAQLPTTLDHIKSIVKSNQMRTRFEEDLLFPFCFNMKCAYSHSQEKSVDDWLVPDLQNWAKRIACPFEFESRESLNGKERRHSLVKIGVKGVQYCAQVLHDAEEIAYGMTLRTKAMTKGKKKNDNYWEVKVDLNTLGFNDGRVATYLLVNKVQYAERFNGTAPTLAVLQMMDRRRLSFLTHLLVQQARKDNIGIDEVVKKVREACDFMMDKSFVGSKLEDPNALASLPSSWGNSYQPPLPVITPKAQACGDFFLNDMGGLEEDPFHEHNLYLDGGADTHQNSREQGPPMGQGSWEGWNTPLREQQQLLNLGERQVHNNQVLLIGQGNVTGRQQNSMQSLNAGKQLYPGDGQVPDDMLADQANHQHSLTVTQGLTDDERRRRFMERQEEREQMKNRNMEKYNSHRARGKTLAMERVTDMVSFHDHH